MPFKHLSGDDYVSPSGRHFNGSQVRLWYAGGGKFPGQKEETPVKSSGAKEASYANGGPVVGKVSPFMKTPNKSEATRFGRKVDFINSPDEFRDRDAGDAPADADQKYAKSGEGQGNGEFPAPVAASKS